MSIGSSRTPFSLIGSPFCSPYSKTSSGSPLPITLAVKRSVEWAPPPSPYRARASRLQSQDQTFAFPAEPLRPHSTACTPCRRASFRQDSPLLASQSLLAHPSPRPRAPNRPSAAPPAATPSLLALRPPPRPAPASLAPRAPRTGEDFARPRRPRHSSSLRHPSRVAGEPSEHVLAGTCLPAA